MYVDELKLAGKVQHTDRMWIVLNKEVDLGKSTSFFDHDVVDNYSTMFESRLSAGGTEKLPYSENISCFFMVL